MQPPSRDGPGFRPGPPPSNPPRAKPATDTHRDGLNEFPWVRAILTADDRAYKNVGVRYKGHFTYGASRNLLKRSLKIDLEHYGGDNRFGPLKKITLNAGVLDPARSREALAYAAYRDAGVPAPRTAFAEVALTIPGQYHREYVGLFTMVEDVDKPFLKDRFDDAKGLLMKPEGVRGADYLGEDWDAYKMRYQPNREASLAEAKLLLALARLIEKADAAEFRQRIGDYLDLDKFLRYLAVTAMLVNLDSPLAMGQNFFIYLPTKTKKAVFMPWDLDLTFAAWPMGGPPEQQMNLSLLHPHAGEHKLIERLLADEEVRARYLKIIQDLSTTSFTQRELLTRIGIVENAIKEPLAREAKALSARNESDAARQAGQIASQAPSLRAFAVKRPASIQSQLKNPETGYVPMGMRGPPGGGRPNLPPGLRAKMDQLRNTMERLQKSGKPTPDIGEKLQQFGPLLGAGEFVEAEALLDLVLHELKNSK